MPSDIQVFVTWKDQTIFAGEDVECTITFKNVAESNANPSHGDQPAHQRRHSRAVNTPSNSESFFSLKSPFSQSRRSYPISPSKKPFHRVSSSLNSPWFGSHSFPPPSTPSTPRNGPPPSHKHKRSVSILSIDSENAGEKASASNHPPSRPKPARGHGRSASLQVPPRRNDSYEEAFMKGGQNAARGFLPTKSPINASPGNLNTDLDRLRANRPGSAANSPVRPDSSRTPRRPPLPPIDFKFPPEPPSASEQNHTRSSVSPSMQSGDENAASATPARPRSRDIPPNPPPLSVPQLTRITSASSLSGSNRNSGEFYSVSGNSSETLQSEYTNYSMNAPRIGTPRHGRHSSVQPSSQFAHSQTLLMGYAQVSASFTVDGSLINQSAFEDVKRKGVVGGQANGAGIPSRGAPGREKTSKGGGFWGALRWNAIEESISGLLSNNELDGLRDMRGVSSSRSIPLLSTSQSLLFVDLRLAPGEERSYSFAFTLPSGLPASHKGKAIKISYNLVIGTQRPSVPNEPQRVNKINIPFRVFNGVDGRGNILGHDLMSPYVLLRDEARVQKVGTSAAPFSKQNSISAPTWTSASEFLSYVDEILEQRSQGDALHPPASPKARRVSSNGLKHPVSCKDAIDMAILRSNQANRSMRSPNRFDIARNGRRIAVVVLNRPAHRLGERIIATIDFANTALPCYAVRATLETSEKVSPVLAVRSSASIHRATRRIYASFFENTLYSTRVVFSPAVPISATPTALTSGVSHEWELRVEFVMPSSHGELEAGPSGTGLLEATSTDNRGSVMSALEKLGCESFEVSIPVTIYGETVRERLPEESEGYSI